jgi:hypothetical protein
MRCAVSAAFGLSLAGFKAFVGAYENFLLTCSIEVAHQRARIILLGGMAGVSASYDGYRHQAVEDVGLTRTGEFTLPAAQGSGAASLRMRARSSLSPHLRRVWVVEDHARERPRCVHPRVSCSDVVRGPAPRRKPRPAARPRWAQGML